MVEALGTGFTMGTGCALLERKQDSGAHVEAAVPRKERAREAEEGEGKRAGRGRTRHQASTMSLDDGREEARAWIPQQAAGDRKSEGVGSSLKQGRRAHTVKWDYTQGQAPQLGKHNPSCPDANRAPAQELTNKATSHRADTETNTQQQEQGSRTD